MRASVIGVAAIGAVAGAVGLAAVTTLTPTAFASDSHGTGCPVAYNILQLNLRQADEADHSGLDNHYWAVIVNREGVVCAVAFSGEARDQQWLLSRQIAAAKAFTANGLSLDGAPLSTAQLYSWVQPGAPANPLFGLAFGNPLSPEDAYKGNYDQFGTRNDPMVGQPLRGHLGRWRARFVRRHGLRGSFHRMAPESAARAGAERRRRSDHARQLHGTPSLPERHEHAGKALEDRPRS
jgi:hypothetical protein